MPFSNDTGRVTSYRLSKNIPFDRERRQQLEAAFKEQGINNWERTEVKHNFWRPTWKTPLPRDEPFWALVECDNVEYEDEPFVALMIVHKRDALPSEDPDHIGNEGDEENDWRLSFIDYDVYGKMYIYDKWSGGGMSVVSWRPAQDQDVTDVAVQLRNLKRDRANPVFRHQTGGWRNEERVDKLLAEVKEWIPLTRKTVEVFPQALTGFMEAFNLAGDLSRYIESDRLPADTQDRFAALRQTLAMLSDAAVQIKAMEPKRGGIVSSTPDD